MLIKNLARLGAILSVVFVLQACGTLYATTPNPRTEEVMLLGYDPVSYFTQKSPVRGRSDMTVMLPGRTYYFSSWENKRLFLKESAKYEPQYAGFCANGAAYAIKLGSDPSHWEIVNGRLFIFGDVLGQELWKMDAAKNIELADKYWPQASNVGWRQQSLTRYIRKVENYQSGAQLMAQWRARNPGKELKYDPGSMYVNLVPKLPGWRAAEGFGQPKLGYPD